MNLSTILTGGGISIVVLLSLVEVSKIEINPWSALVGFIGKHLNAGVLQELEEVKQGLNEVQTKIDQTDQTLNDHIRIDDERNADLRRTRILRFNNELLQGLDHTREDYIDTLQDIDAYEDYCAHHEDYENNRAEYAIRNIKKRYEMHLENRDFIG